MPAELPVEQFDARIPLRNEPVQARSTARLATLLDAAASIIDEVGFERLTTAMVSERAGASIGTVYRYFPDRIALLQALGARNLERVLTRADDAVLDPANGDWVAALNAALDVLVDAFRTEPGFRSVRVGDVIDLRPAPNARGYNTIVSDRILDGLLSRFGFADSAELRFAFETTIEISDALCARAFARNAQGENAFLDVSRDIALSMLVPYLGDPAPVA
ncbi:MAG: TetR/AcrR family transcriptional regulator [Rhodoglobus sp.]